MPGREFKHSGKMNPYETPARPGKSNVQPLKISNDSCDSSDSQSKTAADKMKRQVAFLYIWLYVYLGTLNPFLPSYFFEKLQLPTHAVGLLNGLSPMMNLVAAPLWGMLADHLQARKQMLIFVLTMTTVADISLLIYRIPTVDDQGSSLWLLINLRILSAIFYSSIKGLMDSYTISCLSEYSSKASAEHGKIARTWGEVATGVTSAGIGHLVYASSTPRYDIAFGLRLLSFVPLTYCLVSMGHKLKESPACCKEDIVAFLHQGIPECNTPELMHDDLCTPGAEDVTLQLVAPPSPIPGDEVDTLASSCAQMQSIWRRDETTESNLDEKSFGLSQERCTPPYSETAGFLVLVFCNGLTCRYIETFASICVRQTAAKTALRQDSRVYSTGISTIFDLFQIPLGRGSIMSICRICLSLGGTFSYYYITPRLLSSNSKLCNIYRVNGLSVLLYGVTSMLYGMETIKASIAAETLRGVIYAFHWTACTHHVQTLTHWGFGRSTLQTILEAVYKGLGHTLGSVFGGQLLAHYETLPIAFAQMGRIIVCTSITLAVLSEMFFYLSSKQNVRNRVKID